jgi:hypothetical protein
MGTDNRDHLRYSGRCASSVRFGVVDCGRRRPTEDARGHVLWQFRALRPYSTPAPIRRQGKWRDLRYVAVGLGYSPKRRRQNWFDLFVLLDEVIVTRNK